MSPAATRFWGRTASGVRTIAASCASFFEVDRNFVAVAALKALADAQLLPAKKVAEAIELYRIDPEKRDPMTS